MNMKEDKSPLTPETTFCPNFDCPARGQVGEGNIGVHSQQDRRYLCRVCQKTFSATTGTVFYRLRKGQELITLVVTLLAHGCPLTAIVVAFQLDERTVRNWQEKSGAQAQQVHAHLVEQPRALGQVQADEMYVKAQGKKFWLASAIQVVTRLWLGGAVSPQRDSTLLERMLGHVKGAASALGGSLLFCTDGLVSYPPAILRVFREKEPRHGQTEGRCRLVTWPNLLIAQMIKQYEGHRVVGVTRRIYQGTKEMVQAIIRQTPGQTDINTAYSERLNGTFRARLHSLARRTRALVRQSQTLETGMFLVGTIYNFCTEQESLRLPGLVGGHKWLGRTPAMASGITDHRWSVHELLSYKVPPRRGVPVNPHGRPSKAFKALIARWCK